MKHHFLLLLLYLVTLPFQNEIIAQQKNYPQVHAQMETREICRIIFVNLEQKDVYKTCTSSLKYDSISSEIGSVRGTFFGLGILVGLIGLIPLAQDPSQYGILVAGGIIFSLGLVALLPEITFSLMASGRKKSAIEQYNKITADKKMTGDFLVSPNTTLALQWRSRF